MAADPALRPRLRTRPTVRLRAPPRARPHRCRGRVPGRPAGAAEPAAPDALTRPAARGAGPARAGVRGLGGLHRPRQLRDQLHRRGEVWLRPGLGHRGRQPDGHAGAVPVREGGRGHRPGPRRAVPGPPAAAGVDRPVGPGRAHRHGHRSGRVRRRRAGPEPAVPRAAARRGTADGPGRVRDPGPRSARLPPVRAGRVRPARHHLPRVRLRSRGRAAGPVGAGQRPGAGLPRARRPAADRGHHRRHRDAARRLPALRADQVPGGLCRRRGAPRTAPLPAAGRGRRARRGRAGQPGHAGRGGRDGQPGRGSPARIR